VNDRIIETNENKNEKKNELKKWLEKIIIETEI
jgi:hypothetical protein